MQITGIEVVSTRLIEGSSSYSTWLELILLVEVLLFAMLFAWMMSMERCGLGLIFLIAGIFCAVITCYTADSIPKEYDIAYEIKIVDSHGVGELLTKYDVIETRLDDGTYIVMEKTDEEDSNSVR